MPAVFCFVCSSDLTADTINMMDHRQSIYFSVTVDRHALLPA